MTTWGYVLLVLLTLVAAYSAASLWFFTKRVKRGLDRSDAAVRAAELITSLTPDYVVSISDWGPDFEFSPLGRWRWVIWRDERVGAPLDVGNALHANSAWHAVLSVVNRAWPPDALFTPRILVEWKKVTADVEDHS